MHAQQAGAGVHRGLACVDIAPRIQERGAIGGDVVPISREVAPDIDAPLPKPATEVDLHTVWSGHQWLE
ncbi:hypothetical protein A8M77_06945 [Variovorax sp. JS1663]|nr:hypothetical protein A8M77_06945 [Variovorax sp. JS1663]